MYICLREEIISIFFFCHQCAGYRHDSTVRELNAFVYNKVFIYYLFRIRRCGNQYPRVFAKLSTNLIKKYLKNCMHMCSR